MNSHTSFPIWLFDFITDSCTRQMSWCTFFLSQVQQQQQPPLVIWAIVITSDDDHRTAAPHAYVVLLFMVYSGQLCLVFCLVFLAIWVVAESEAQIIFCNTSVSLCKFLVSNLFSFSNLILATNWSFSLFFLFFFAFIKFSFHNLIFSKHNYKESSNTCISLWPHNNRISWF